MKMCSFIPSKEVLKEIHVYQPKLSLGEQRLKDNSGLERINKLIGNEDDHTT